jgi:hypothetical protein
MCSGGKSRCKPELYGVNGQHPIVLALSTAATLELQGISWVLRMPTQTNNIYTPCDPWHMKFGRIINMSVRDVYLLQTSRLASYIHIQNTLFHRHPTKPINSEAQLAQLITQETSL